MRLLLQVLIVTATAGYRHESIPAAEQVLSQIAAGHGIDVAFARTEDEMRVRLASLDGVRALFFVNTTGELPMAEAVVAWVRGGGTFVGVHSASDTWHAVPEYIELLGGEFAGHPPETSATLFVDDPAHAATRALPATHALYEEFYYLAHVNEANIRPLLSLRARPEPPHDARYFPLAWEKRFGKGRVLYTALGHREDVWHSEWFRAHMNGIVQWALTAPPAQPKRRAVRR